MLTQEQVDFYRTNGYITVEQAVASESIDAMLQATDEFVEKSRQASDHTNEFDLEPGHSAQAPRLRRLKGPENLHRAYDRVFRQPSIIEMIAQLVGPAVRHFGGKLNMKSAGFGSPVHWHQDHAFSPRTNDDVLAVGIPLDDMDAGNGCLLVVPGSHRGPIFNHYQDSVFVGAVTEPDFDPQPVVPLELKAGDISIHHGRLLHASAPNTDPNRSRRLYLGQYCAADAWPVKNPPQDMEAYNKCMVRGEAPTQPRYTDVPPTPEPEEIRPGKGGSIYESQTQLTASNRSF
ncbi:MAG: phytanoyl-CoA dioxygenase family protein [Candidatus Latescibacteria bacterium]|nr:phytanoyl-CoA dioxygenase family protein [Candidatus Latescibacterota bacterium]